MGVIKVNAYRTGKGKYVKTHTRSVIRDFKRAAKVARRVRKYGGSAEGNNLIERANRKMMNLGGELNIKKGLGTRKSVYKSTHHMRMIRV